MSIAKKIRLFARERRGNVAMLTAFMLVPVLVGVGAAVDYGRMVATQNTLDMAAHAASAAAVATGRSLLTANPAMPLADVQSAAVTQATKAFAAQVSGAFGPSVTVTEVGVMTINPASRYDLSEVSLTQVGNTLSAKVVYTSKINTTLMNLVGIKTLPLGGSSAANGPLAGEVGDTTYVVHEGFETADHSTWGGGWGVYNQFHNWQAAQPLEIGKSQAYENLPAPEGIYVAELDGYANTAISKKVYLPRGSYELRYWFIDRVNYRAYAPAWICGTKPADVAWATASDSEWGARYQSNRVGVYLDVALNDTAPTTFTPESNNLIDVCNSSGHKWVERSVKVTINTPGYFWLTFQAEGQSDGVGGLIDDIRMCANTCAGTAKENFPWTANTVVFSDNFEAYATYTGAGKLTVSGTNNGWSSLATGWSTAPYNQMDFWDGRTGLGVELDAGGNRTIHKRFLLDPGYYQVQYAYNAQGQTAFGANVYCGATAALANFPLVSAVSNAYPLWWGTKDGSSAAIGVYMDADRNFASPANPTGALNEAAVWYNPDGSADNATYPHLPGQLIDFCSYSTNFITRSVPVRIQKAGFYWLTFKAEGTSDMFGGMVDDVSITALGGLTMSSPPSGAVTITPAGLAAGTPIVLGAIEVAVQ
ncbi:MAG: hypothetical protein JWM36_1423 [Hyphomicrobiales bacterium]|nr:hypothetical protein [Hyphomicrobiales bacterium]